MIYLRKMNIFLFFPQSEQFFGYFKNFFFNEITRKNKNCLYYIHDIFIFPRFSLENFFQKFFSFFPLFSKFFVGF